MAAIHTNIFSRLSYDNHENNPESIVVQVLKIKTMMTEGSQARYKLELSDGVNSSTAIVATQVASQIESLGIHENTIIRITNYRCNVMKDVKMMILNDFEKVQDMNHPIGNVSIQQKPSSVPQYQNNPYGNAPPPAPYGSSYNQNNAPSYGQQQQQAPYGQTSNAPYGQPQAAPYGQASNAPPQNAYGYGGVANSRPVIRDDSAALNISPISSINPYSNKWTIKARVTSKSAIKSWSNQKGEGTLFSIDLLDSHGSEIRATFFKDACQKFYPEIEESKVYTFSGGSLKVVANSNFSRIKNPYELTFDVRSDIKPASDDGSSIKTQTYEFTKIGALQNTDPGAIVDVIGIVKNCGEVTEIISQKMGGKTLQKRDLLIMDDSNHDISVTLWGEKAITGDQFANAIVAFKGLKLGDYSGRTLGTINSSVLKVNPEIPEGHALAMWRSNNINNLNQAISLSGGGGGGGGGVVDPLEKRKSIASLKNEQLGMGDKAEFATVRAFIGFVKKESDPYYPACNNISADGKACNKKMIQNNSSWICERCQISKPSPDYRYILSCTVMDYSGMSWVTLFNEQAEKVLLTKANDLHDMKEQGQEEEYNRILAIPKFQEYNLKLRVKFELGGGGNDGESVQRQKCIVQQLYEMDYVSEGKQLIDAINNKFN